MRVGQFDIPCRGWGAFPGVDGSSDVDDCADGACKDAKRNDGPARDSLTSEGALHDSTSGVVLGGLNVISMAVRNYSGTIYRLEFRKHNFWRRLNLHAGYRKGGYRGKTITPHGPVPTGIVATTVLSARFTAEMLFDGPLAE